MGKLHVFEEIDHRHGKAEELYLFEGQVHAVFETTGMSVPILRRLTDAEVDAKLVAATRVIAVDTDRARFVRETAARLVGTPVTTSEFGTVWYRSADEAIKEAEYLADRFFEAKQP